MSEPRYTVREPYTILDNGVFVAACETGADAVRLCDLLNAGEAARALWDAVEVVAEKTDESYLQFAHYRTDYINDQIVLVDVWRLTELWEHTYDNYDGTWRHDLEKERGVEADTPQAALIALAAALVQGEETGNVHS